MVRIRLRRVGAPKQPSFRIVVTDRRNPRDGRFIESIGHYNPRTEPATMGVNEERVYHWLGNGAQPSEAVERIFKQLGTLERFKRLRAGEPLEDLLEEAEAAAAARPEVDPRTRRDDLTPADYKSKATATITEAAADTADDEPEAEVDETAETEAEVEAEDEAEEVAEEADEEDEEQERVAEDDKAEEEEEEVDNDNGDDEEEESDEDEEDDE